MLTRLTLPALPLGYQQFAAGTMDAAVALTVPTGATYAVIQCETQAIRMRDDGVNPTVATGVLLAVNTIYELPGRLPAYKFISAVVGAVMNILYYGSGNA